VFWWGNKDLNSIAEAIFEDLFVNRIFIRTNPLKIFKEFYLMCMEALLYFSFIQ